MPVTMNVNSSIPEVEDVGGRMRGHRPNAAVICGTCGDMQ